MKQLIGNWITDPDYVRPGDELVNLEFTEDGRLIYTIIHEDRYQIINLIYTVEGTILITDQPSHPSIERTEFELSDEQLILKYAEKHFYYVRMKVNLID